ncbi:uncharacterized protein LOC121936253 [Sceloporus undulatus]|uniref:uncharacterized protein LOC121936253 n=1 Tax=Sceloporus undulatus TaxID=8520 RepID=UPI001C4C436C|nr:uncharacterized protein LOC121936253 [Sceloporus undulatus]
MKMAENTFLAPALLWLMVVIVPGAEGAERPPEAPPADPRALLLLLPVPRKRPEGPRGSPTQQGGFQAMEQEEEKASETLRERPSEPGPLGGARGISGVLEKSFQISASALVFAAFCGWGVMMPFCQPQKLQIRGKAWKWLSLYANGLACLASALALVALALWSYDQGFPAIFIFPTILLLHVILVTALVVVTIIFRLDVLHQVTDRAAQRMLDLTTPGGAIVVAVISSLLIKCIRRLQEEEHAEPVDLTAVVAGAAAMCLLPAVIIVVVHCMDMQKRAEEERISRRKKWNEDIQQGRVSLMALSGSSLVQGEPAGH